MDELGSLLRDAADTAGRYAPPLDPWPALRRRQARQSYRRRLQVTAGALLAFAVVGQVMLTSPASGAVRPSVSAASSTVLVPPGHR